MSYIKTEWKAREGTNLNRFLKIQETDTTVILENAPDEITVPGTPFSIDNMNHIESGIFEAHEVIKTESQIRSNEDTALQNAINTEASASVERDHVLQDNIDYTNGNLYDLQKNFNAWIGRGGFLDPYDFGATPTQNDLTNYALTQISSISDPLLIWNGTSVKNLFNGHVWTLNNTQDTDPPIFEWKDQGLLEIDFFGENIGGIIKGATSGDAPEYVRPAPDGRGYIDVQAMENNFLEKIFHIGIRYTQGPGDYDPYEANLPGQWALWNERVDTYEMITESAYNTLFSQPPAYWKISDTIAANQYRIWTPMGIEISGTRRIIKSNKAVTASPLAMNSIDWDDLSGIVYAFRKELHSVWDDNDKMIGDAVVYNGQPMRIVGILTPSGIFSATAGGNRRPFGGGVGNHIVDALNVPDYANMQTTNRVTVGSSWINNQGNGFISATQRSGNAVYSIYINNVAVTFNQGGSGYDSQFSIMLPIKNGDIIRIEGSSAGTAPRCYFIPSLSTGSNIGTVSKNVWRKVA